MERVNINRGFKNLRVWQDAVELYVLSTKVFSSFPYELKKVSANSMDSAHSISRNIAEGYCRRSIKEYLNFLNIALGSSGEFHSSCICFLKANQISEIDFESLDQLHFKTENELLKLIKALQMKVKDNNWQDNFNIEK
jgi:four helix bundle protein